ANSSKPRYASFASHPRARSAAAQLPAAARLRLRPDLAVTLQFPGASPRSDRVRSSIWPGASHGRVVLPGVGVDTEIDIGAADATDRQSERQSPMAGCGWASLCCHESARTWRLTLPLPTRPTARVEDSHPI